MSNKPEDLLAALRAFSDDDLSSAMALDPELIKKAQKALQDARQKKIELDKKKSAALAAASGRPFDLKAWQKAKKLITGPYNEANAAEFQAAMAKTDPNIAPEGEQSLLRISMDYLAERQSVILEWPQAVFEAGCEFGYDEARALVKLYTKRGGCYNLGPQAAGLLTSLFCKALPWAEFETKLLAEKAISGPLVEYFQKHAFGSSLGPKETRNWEAVENLARSGCQSFSIKADPNSYRPTLPWESLVALATEHGPAGQAKVSAFSAIIELGWCDVGATQMSDNLQIHERKANFLLDCGSRSSLLYLPLDSTSIEIFNMLCERESSKGFSRYDELGRSRLYFVNERMRTRSNDPAKDRKILLALAQIAIELGDAPESVNPQNPLAKAADPYFAQLLAAAIEKREIGGSVAGAAAPKRKSPSI